MDDMRFVQGCIFSPFRAGRLWLPQLRCEHPCATRRASDSPSREEYAQVGRLLNDRPGLPRVEAWKLLVQTLSDWTQRMDLPRLRAHEIQRPDIPRIVANCRGSSMKANSVMLIDAEVREVLKQRLCTNRGQISSPNVRQNV